MIPPHERTSPPFLDDKPEPLCLLAPAAAVSQIVSIHEYELKPDADPAQFEAAVRQARDRNLLALPGLVDYYLLKGIKGDRVDRYAAVWIYESRAAWDALWGPPDDPVDKEEYPDSWQIWEDEVLAPFLHRDPDTIRFTSYRELSD